MSTLSLSAEPLTREAFAPFGRVIDVDGANSFFINEGTTERFHALAAADVSAEGGAPIVSIFRASARPKTIKITMMERHPLGSQAFFPLSDHPWFVVVSSANKPSPENLKAFRAHGRQGVQYAKNVWHHPLLATENNHDFLIVDRDGPGENLEEVFFENGAHAVLNMAGE